MTPDERGARKWQKAKYYEKWAKRQGLNPETIAQLPELIGLNAQDAKIFKGKQLPKKK